MAHLCHVELANRAHVPPDNSALCFSLKCRIHCRLIKTVGFMRCKSRWLHPFSNLRRMDKRGLGSNPKSRCMPDRNVPRDAFPARQTVAQSAFGSNNDSATDQSGTMRPGGVGLAVTNESTGSVLTTETNSSGEFYFLLFYPPATQSRRRRKDFEDLKRLASSLRPKIKW
jgi:hypothetical protein